MDLPVKTSNSDRYKIEARNLSYKLPPKYNELKWLVKKLATNNKTSNYILRNVSCEAKPGEITAVAGPSGAGKTTLLDILAGNVGPSRFSGHVLVNDQPMKPANFRRISGYVTQDESLFPLLTVEETLMYSARFRLREGDDKAKDRVTKLLNELGLDHVGSMKVGSESSRTISGGEKRRVAIGVELVHDPAVILLDEPTSGLDSASAFHLMYLLKTMAKNQGKTIILTIHQPGFRILELFDKAVLLSNGFVLHNGSLHLLEEKLKSTGHFIPHHVNVLEFAIDITESLAESLHYGESDIEKCETETESDNMPNKNAEEKQVLYSNSPLKEVLILSQRFCRNIFRTKQLFLAKVIQALLVGLILGSIFFNAYSNTKNLELQSQVGFFAFSLTFLLSSNTEALPIFLEERRILMRETSRGAYRIYTYNIANTIVFLPFLLIVALLYAIPVYWLVGLRYEFSAFAYYTLVSWMIFAMGNSFVAACSALVPNFLLGMSFIGCLIGAFFLFSGYFISKESIPIFWLFVHYLSLFKYPFECFLINEYGGENGKLKCIQKVDGVCLMYGEQLLARRGLEESQKWINIGIMLSFIFGYRFLCFLILWYRSIRNKC
ncbi:ABC transporter G family member 10-like [Nicotiana tabacum]|uniref:ABC transporter G family member 10-like n=1 Tax=Nicotiana tabacum TaxID=4097 RepID=A0A1S4AG50_TOBAC|nr:PREDICTED: ABC transporter G family member 10-like [Nicotiana tabacum]